jgi:hypothetical protein
MKRTTILTVCLALVIAFTIGTFFSTPIIQAASDVVSTLMRENVDASSDDKSFLVELSGSTNDFSVGGDLTVNGWYETPPIIVAAQSYTITSASKAADYIVEWSDTAVYDITLPASMADGTEITVCDGDLNAGTNNGTVYPSGTDTIQETTSFVQNANGECETFKYVLTNTDWTIKAGYLE